jgi:hypothetical protein
MSNNMCSLHLVLKIGINCNRKFWEERVIMRYTEDNQGRENLRFDYLSLWSWPLLETPSLVQPLENFPTFYGPRIFIIAFTRALNLSLSWATSIQTIPPHSISQRSIFALSTHLRLGPPGSLLPSGLPTDNLYALLVGKPEGRNSLGRSRYTKIMVIVLPVWESESFFIFFYISQFICNL